MLRSLTLALGLLALAVTFANRPSTALAAVEEPAVVAETAASGEAVAERAEADHGEVPNILEPQLPLAFWTLVVFLLLLLVLWRFAWGPLSAALDAREHNLQATLDATETARADAERMLAEHRKIMQEANQQVKAILDEARRDAGYTADQLRRTAQQDAEATMERARREIENARDHALLDIWERTADLAVATAGKVLGRELQDEEHRRLVDAARDVLPSSPEGLRA